MSDTKSLANMEESIYISEMVDDVTTNPYDDGRMQFAIVL